MICKKHGCQNPVTRKNMVYCSPEHAPHAMLEHRDLALQKRNRRISLKHFAVMPLQVKVRIARERCGSSLYGLWCAVALEKLVHAIVDAKHADGFDEHKLFDVVRALEKSGLNK